MPLALNQQLEYRIERVLGQGAFGTIYRLAGLSRRNLAHDTLPDRIGLRKLAFRSIQK